MRTAQNYWSTLLDMLHHDFQATYGYPHPPDVIPMKDIEAGPDPNNDLEIIEEVHPIATYVVEHKEKKERSYSDSSSDEEGPTMIVLPVMDPLQFAKFKDLYPQSVVIESKALANIPIDEIDDIRLLPSTSGM